MKRPITRTRYLIHLFLIGVVLCLFLSTTWAAERTNLLKQGGDGEIELASPVEMDDLSVMENSPCRGEVYMPSALVKDTTQAADEGVLEFKDRYMVCSKTVDKGCVIVGLTETRK